MPARPAVAIEADANSGIMSFMKRSFQVGGAALERSP
jgi:hypothetical protein